MATLVLQSHAPDRMVGWLARARTSVQAWAESKGYAYEFLDDRLFDAVPREILEKTSSQKVMATDLARLLVIEQRLSAGMERVVWLDCDVAVAERDAFDPIPDLRDGYVLGREVWVQLDAKSRPEARINVHNALLVFEAGNPFLPFYRHAAQSILEKLTGPAVPQLVGPKLLTSLANTVPLSLSSQVGMTSPLVLADVAAGGGEALDMMVAKEGGLPPALNLCASLEGRTVDGVSLEPDLYSRTLDRLGVPAS